MELDKAEYPKIGSRRMKSNKSLLILSLVLIVVILIFLLLSSLNRNLSVRNSKVNLANSTEKPTPPITFPDNCTIVSIENDSVTFIFKPIKPIDFHKVGWARSIDLSYPYSAGLNSLKLNCLNQNARAHINQQDLEKCGVKNGTIINYCILFSTTKFHYFLFRFGKE